MCNCACSNVGQILSLLILFLLLGLFKEAVHDADSDEDTTNHRLGEDNHSLIFHHCLYTITVLVIMNYKYTYIYIKW